VQGESDRKPMCSMKQRPLAVLTSYLTITFAIDLTAFDKLAAPWDTSIAANYQESTDLLPNNPNRGFYLPLDDPDSILASTTFDSNQGHDLNTIRYLLCMADFCNSSNIAPKVSELQNVLSHLKTQGKRALLRVHYSGGTNGAGVNICGHYYPNTNALAHAHASTIAGVVNSFPEAIGFVEAGFFGPWGEWNCWGSGGCINSWADGDLFNSGHRRDFAAHLATVLSSQIPLLLRRPVFKLEGKPVVADSDRVGLHNDCFLTTYNSWEIDFWTYSADFGGYNYGSTTTQELWNQTAAMSHSIPMGGETCQSTPNRFACELAVPEMQQLHMDYLNSGYHLSAIAEWVNGGCYNEIAKKLGYRFHLASVTAFPATVEPNATIHVTLELQNLGFGKLTKPYRIELALSGPNGSPWYGVGTGLTLLSPSATPTLNTILAGQNQSITFSFMAPPTEGSFGLEIMLSDPSNWRPKYSIQLATVDSAAGMLWNPARGVHEIRGVTFTVNTQASLATSDYQESTDLFSKADHEDDNRYYNDADQDWVADDDNGHWQEYSGSI